MKSERTVQRILNLSDRRPSIEVKYTLRIELPGDEYGTTSIGPVSMLPDYLHDTLWLDTVVKGLHDSIRAAKFSLVTSAVNVEILELTFSEPLDSMLKSELASLGSALYQLTYETLLDMLNSMISRPAPMSFDDANRLILVHGYKYLEDARSEDGFLGSLMLHHVYLDKQTVFTLDEKNFKEVMYALDSVIAYSRGVATIDRRLMSSLWDMCLLGMLLIKPDEAWLKRGIMTSYQAGKLQRWIGVVTHAVTSFLQGTELDCVVLANIVLEEQDQQL